MPEQSVPTRNGVIPPDREELDAAEITSGFAPNGRPPSLGRVALLLGSPPRAPDPGVSSKRGSTGVTDV